VKANAVPYQFKNPQPGDWTFTDPPDVQPRYMRIACPGCGLQSLLPIAPMSFSTGESFCWDGNRETPTLTGTIVCLLQFQGCGWEGTLVAGEFRADDD
jgi:hypothetical protein